jgi:hypothetical protein
MKNNELTKEHLKLIELITKDIKIDKAEYKRLKAFMKSKAPTPQK